MTELEMLHAFGEIVDEKINKALEPVKQDLTSVKQDLTSVKQDLVSVKADVSDLKDRMASVEGRLASMDGRLTAVETQTADLRRDMRDVKRDVWRMGEELRRVALTQENEVLPKLQLIYENQTQIIDEHREMDRLDTVWSVLKDDVDALKFIAQDNTKEIQRMKKAL